MNGSAPDHAADTRNEPGGLRGPRAEVQAAASRLFSEHGYAATSVRRIAATAGVDPALVIRYFGSKETLFVRTMTMTDDFDRLLAGPIGGLGEEMVGFVIRRLLGMPGDGPSRTAGVFAALVRASDREPVRRHLRWSIEETIVAKLAPRLSGADAGLRSRLVAAQLSGLITQLVVIGDEALAAAPREAVVRRYGAAVQSLLDA